MSLLGFDAPRGLALGEVPAKDGDTALIARVGGFVAAGQDAMFINALAAKPEPLVLSGKFVSLNMGGTFDAGSIMANGIAAAFSVLNVAAFAGFAIAGVDSKYALCAIAAYGELALSGFSDPGVVALRAEPAAFTLAGVESNYSRGFEAWVWPPFAGATWQVQVKAASSSSSWTGAAQPFRTWAAEPAPAAKAWAPASIQFESWRTK